MAPILVEEGSDLARHAVVDQVLRAGEALIDGWMDGYTYIYIYRERERYIHTYIYIYIYIYELYTYIYIYTYV